MRGVILVVTCRSSLVTFFGIWVECWEFSTKIQGEEILQGFQDDPFRRVSLVTNDPRFKQN